MLYIQTARSYWADWQTPDEESLTATVFGGRVGYGIMLGTRFRVTPQLGVGALSVRSDNVSASALTASFGARCECALARFVGVSLTPEYGIALSKSPLFKELTELSSRINGWASGFNVRLGIYFYF